MWRERAVALCFGFVVTYGVVAAVLTVIVGSFLAGRWTA